ncbi:MAG: cytosine deaminase [Spirochaetaceae bacterium]|nr:MAG: cytosine deaminase [Spirochaetaceae bacterium]
MVDLLVRNVHTPYHSDPVDIAVNNTRVEQVASRIETPARRTVEGQRRLAIPPFVDAHFHLDSVLTRVPNLSGTLREGIDNWARYKQDNLSVEDVYDRARRYCEHAFAMGIQAIRSHVDVCDPQLRGAEALTRLKRDIADRIDIQLVAFPQDGFFSAPQVRQQLLKALDMGVDVVGGIPHNEPMYQQGTESLHELMQIAAERGLLVDIHCDESDDPNSRHVETLAALTARSGMGGRVTASHITATAVMDAYYVSRKLIPMMAGAGINVICNPLINIHLGGHFSYPKHRAMAPIRELLAAGLTVGCAQDCNEDPWYPLGNADMLEVARMGAHIGHMMGLDALRTMFDTVTTLPATIMQLPDYGLEPGCRANLVLVGAESVIDALRISAPREVVIRHGHVVIESGAPRTDSA